MSEPRFKAIVLTDIPDTNKVWWRRYVDANETLATATIRTDSIPDADVSILSVSILKLLFATTLRYFTTYRKYEFIVTFQAKLSTTLIGVLSRLGGKNRPKHIVLQFHLRERTDSFTSRLKYRVLGYALTDAEKIICSSTEEIRYYSETFSLPIAKFAFIPLCVDPRLLTSPTTDGDYILSAGKTLRDYKTLVQATAVMNVPVVIVADAGSMHGLDIPDHVQLLTDIPYGEYLRLLAKCRFVVIPLQNTSISTGQSVALTAMALGKAVIITETSGTTDYVRDNVSGILVKPYDHIMLKHKIAELMEDRERVGRIGLSAKIFVEQTCVIQRYLDALVRHAHVEPLSTCQTGQDTKKTTVLCPESPSR